MSQKINNAVFYVGFPAVDLAATQRFYERAFGWSFQDYGLAYLAFEDGQLSGGFYLEANVAPARRPLVVLWADDLAASQAAVEAAGGQISTPAYGFPGGRRFHFTDPSGNELAVCAEA